MIEIIDLYPDKAQYRPNETGHIIMEYKLKGHTPCKISVEFKRLHQLLWHEVHLAKPSGEQVARLPIVFKAEDVVWGCYGVDVKIIHDGKVVLEQSTAFDVADHWRRAPRYGFLSDFGAAEQGQLADVEQLNKFHLNIIQFYDWMYRHDDLIPPSDVFTDPMGRELSYTVIKEKIKAVQSKGMAAIAYGAVYAALPDYAKEHQELGLYKRNGEPFELIDLFYLMDISPGSIWNNTIVSEFRKVIAEGFDGIHMDQYGFPKKGVRTVNGKRETVELADCYPALINQTKHALHEDNPDVGLIFNNVSNYPVHTTATAEQDAIYIEVWQPVIHYRELKSLIDRGRELSGDKHVILSAYLPTFHPSRSEPVATAETGALLTMSTIFASGGYHLLLGEFNKALTTAYYPDYGPLSATFVDTVRSYYDFIVRFGSLLYDHALIDVSMTHTGGINTEVMFHCDQTVFAPNGDVNTVWTIVKQLPDYEIIHLINLVGLENDHWDEGKAQRPQVQQNVECTVLMEKEVKGVYVASPDESSIQPMQVDYTIVGHDQGEAIRFTIPELNIWSMVYIEWGGA